MKNILASEHQIPIEAFIDHKKLEEGENCTNLSSSLTNSGDIDHELNYKTRKTVVAFNQLNKIWSSKQQKFSLRTKLRFYNSNVLSTLLYSCETWELKTSQEKKLDTFDSICLCKILGIKSNDTMLNEEVSERSKQALPISHHLQVTCSLVGPCTEAPHCKTNKPSP